MIMTKNDRNDNDDVTETIMQRQWTKKWGVSWFQQHKWSLKRRSTKSTWGKPTGWLDVNTNSWLTNVRQSRRTIYTVHSKKFNDNVSLTLTSTRPPPPSQTQTHTHIHTNPPPPNPPSKKKTNKKTTKNNNPKQTPPTTTKTSYNNNSW